VVGNRYPPYNLKTTADETRRGEHGDGLTIIEWRAHYEAEAVRL